MTFSYLESSSDCVPTNFTGESWLAALLLTFLRVVIGLIMSSSFCPSTLMYMNFPFYTMDFVSRQHYYSLFRQYLRRCRVLAYLSRLSCDLLFMIMLGLFSDNCEARSDRNKAELSLDSTLSACLVETTSVAFFIRELLNQIYLFTNSLVCCHINLDRSGSELVAVHVEGSP